MGLDKENIEKRVSRIELDIDHMNQMIDENLKLNETGHSEDNILMDNVSDGNKVKAADFGLDVEKANQQLAEGADLTDQEELNGKVDKDEVTQSQFKEVLGNAADSFVHGAGKKEESQTSYDNASDDIPRDGSTQESGNPEDGSIARRDSLERFEDGEMAYDGRGTPYSGMEVQLTRSEVSNDEYFDLSEDQPDEVGSEAYSTEQDDPEENSQDHDDPRGASLGQASSIRLHKHALAPTQISPDYEESNDEWEDESEGFGPEELETTPDPAFDDVTQSSTPQIPQQDALQEQETPRKGSMEHQIQSQEQLVFQEQQQGSVETMGHHNQDMRPQTEPNTGQNHATTENESAEQPINELTRESAFQEPSSTVEADQLGSFSSVGARQSIVTQSSNASGGRFRDSLYDVYDEPLAEEGPQSYKEEPRDRSAVGPYHVPQGQETHPYSYSYETFATVEPAPPRTADISQDSDSTFASDTSYNKSLPGTADTDDSIYIPKNSAKAQRPATTSNTPVASRRPTNPFRVVSVGVVGPDGRTSRKTSSGTYTQYKDHNQMDGPAILQKKLDHLTKKCVKLQKEINYLTQMNSSSSLPIEDSRKLARAIAKLQEYLDQKNKEKYDVGVLLSRQLRKEIDRGENGQFWIGTK